MPLSALETLFWVLPVLLRCFLLDEDCSPGWGDYDRPLLLWSHVDAADEASTVLYATGVGAKNNVHVFVDVDVDVLICIFTHVETTT